MSSVNLTTSGSSFLPLFTREECVEGVFCELRLYGVLRSSLLEDFVACVISSDAEKMRHTADAPSLAKTYAAPV
jgi:hypothetical protein